MNNTADANKSSTHTKKRVFYILLVFIHARRWVAEVGMVVLSFIWRVFDNETPEICGGPPLITTYSHGMVSLKMRGSVLQYFIKTNGLIWPSR